MILVMMMVMVRLCLHTGQFLRQCCLAFHGGDQLFTGQFIPGGCNQRCGCVVLPNQRYSSIQLILGNGVCTGENDGRCRFNLIVIELTEVLHINLDFARISHSNGVSQSHFLIGHLFNSGNHIGQLAHAGGFNNHTVGIKLCNHLLQCLAEITNQAAADAAGIHFGNVNTCILQKTTVNTDFAELIFNQNQFLTLVGFLNHLLDQCGFTRTQKAGKHVNFCHIMHLLYIN